MAKKKKKELSVNEVFNILLGLGIGNFAVGTVQTITRKVAPNANDKIVGMAPLAAGGYILKTRGGENDLVKWIGVGLAAGGIKSGLSAIGIGSHNPIEDNPTDIEEVLAVLNKTKDAMGDTEDAEYYEVDGDGDPINGMGDIMYDSDGLPQ